MDRQKLKGNAMLLTSALIWGAAFVAQSVGMQYVGPFTFNGVRSLLGGLVLLPVIMLLDRRSGRRPTLWGTNDRAERSALLRGGVCCGLVLAAASGLQQFGMQHTTVGKAGFITALYIVIVPIFSIFLGRRAGLNIWVSVAIAVGGMYLLCMTDGFTLGRGDMLVLCGAFMFAVHILVIDRFSPKADPVRLSCVQFWVSGIVGTVCSFIFESPEISSILSAWLPICYAGIMSSGVAYTLQIVAQKNMNPTVASLILSLESVFALLSGWVILGQKLTAREAAGCALVFAAIILAQIPIRKRKAVRDEKRGDDDSGDSEAPAAPADR